MQGGTHICAAADIAKGPEPSLRTFDNKRVHPQWPTFCGFPPIPRARKGQSPAALHPTMAAVPIPRTRRGRCPRRHKLHIPRGGFLRNPPLTHSAVPPLQIPPASLGRNLVYPSSHLPTRRGRCHIAPPYRPSGFHQGNVPPAGNFLLVQKVTKDTPGGGAFYKDAPPPVPPPSEDWVDVLIYHLGDFVNRIAPPPKILEIATRMT